MQRLRHGAAKAFRAIRRAVRWSRCKIEEEAEELWSAAKQHNSLKHYMPAQWVREGEYGINSFLHNKKMPTKTVSKILNKVQSNNLQRSEKKLKFKNKRRRKNKRPSQLPAHLFLYLSLPHQLRQYTRGINQL